MKKSDKMLENLKEKMANMTVEKGDIAKAVSNIALEIKKERRRNIFVGVVTTAVLGAAAAAYYKFKK